jgi:hypothetical protein
MTLDKARDLFREAQEQWYKVSEPGNDETAWTLCRRFRRLMTERLLEYERMCIIQNVEPFTHKPVNEALSHVFNER